MQWHKQGLIFAPSGHSEWMQSHATVPVPLHIEGDLFRIYFSSRNKENQNQVGYIEIDLNHPFDILKISDNPVISLGKLGYFDCDGVYGTCIVRTGSKLYFYYAGWNAGLRGLFYSSLGLAISDDGGLSFRKYSEVPIMSRNKVDKWAVMAPFVLKDEGLWRMWYTSGIELYYENDVLKSRYDIKYAFSQDGIHWERSGQSAIDLGERDSNIARACVLKENGIYKAWYPYVNKSLGQYKIGYGESTDGIVFNRKDSEIGIDVSPEGWDSRAVTYPYVFTHKGKKYMLYNGNQFGKTGFGLAVEKKE